MYCNPILSNIMDVKKKYSFPERREGEEQVVIELCLRGEKMKEALVW